MKRSKVLEYTQFVISGPVLLRRFCRARWVENLSDVGTSEI
jgi:hypothetical protein